MSGVEIVVSVCRSLPTALPVTGERVENPESHHVSEGEVSA